MLELTYMFAPKGVYNTMTVPAYGKHVRQHLLKDEKPASKAQQQLISPAMVKARTNDSEVLKALCHGQMTVQQVSKKSGVPVRSVRTSLDRLVENGSVTVIRTYPLSYMINGANFK